jgi:hypothetical protein
VSQFFPLFGPIADSGPIMHQIPVVFLAALVTEQEALGVQGGFLKRPATQLLDPLEPTVIKRAGVFYVPIVVEDSGRLHDSFLIRSP